MTDLEWADKLDKIASAISQTLYDHGIELDKKTYKRERRIMHDDYDQLRVLAKELRIRYHKTELGRLIK